MVFPPDKQNLGVCIALAAMGGAFEVFATVVVAIPDAREKQGVLISQRTLRLAIVWNVLLQIVASLLGNTMSTWFGPVSIVGPVFFASQMVVNMAVFGCLTGLEKFSKEMRVGTWIVVMGVFLIIVNGPQEQDDQDINELITRWYALVWSGVLLTGMAVSSVFMALGVNRYKSEYMRSAILLVARGCALSVNFTVSKPFSMKPGFPMVMVWLAFKIVSGAVYAIAIIIQSTAVTQSIFVPLNTSVTLLLNAITGIIIWEDWRVVNSWLGYVCAFILLVLGIYLLLSDVDFRLLTSENPRYGQVRKFERMRATRNLMHDISVMDLDLSDDEDESKEDGGIEITSGDDNKESEVDEDIIPEDEPSDRFDEDNNKKERKPPARPGLMRHGTKKEAWESLFGFQENTDTTPSMRRDPARQSIFFSGK
mmetsp:Transcript_17777/g.32184  ORF Transcript_17777/g.32184 Transcript_17777/m.32184 type:complete len:423 (-) Transcript_17777:114-1382(-)